MVYAFRSYSRPYFEKMLLIGEVITRSQLMGERQKILGFDTREMILHARLFSDFPLRVGDKVYVVQKDLDHRKYQHALIVAEAEVISLYQTSFQGQMLTARGNLSMVQAHHFVAIPDLRKDREESFFEYKQGERWDRFGEQALAYAHYRKSLQINPQNIQTHLRLGEKAFEQKHYEEAIRHAEEAWQNRRQVQNMQSYIKLGAFYSKVRLFEIESQEKTLENRLKKLVKLKEELKNYRKGFVLLNFITAKNQEIAIKDFDYHYHHGELYKAIWEILEKNPISRVLSWLEKSEREVLYEAMALPLKEKKVADPRENWEEAYLEAALAHYEAAHEINPLDNRAAYQIVQLAYYQLQKGLPQTKQEIFSAMLEHYADEFLSVPSPEPLSMRVRNLKNTFSQR